MLTGAPPDKSVMDAIAQQQQDACLGLLLSCGRRRGPRRRLLEISELSESAQAVLRAFTSTPEASFTVADARAHTWLEEQSVHAQSKATSSSATASSSSATSSASSWLSLDAGGTGTGTAGGVGKVGTPFDIQNLVG